MYHASTQGQAHCIGENNCPQQQIFHHPMIMHHNQHVYGYNVPAYIPNRSVPNQTTLVYPLGYNPNSTYPVMAPGPAVQPKQLAFLPYPGIQPQLHNNPAMYPQFHYIPVMQLHNNPAFYPQFRYFPVIQTNIHRPIEFMQINGCTYYNPLLQNSGSKGSPPHHNLNNIQNIFPVDLFAPQEMSQPEMEINSAKKGSECYMTSLPMKETVALCHDQVSVAAHSQRCLNNSHEILHPITVLQRGNPLQTDLHAPKQVQQPQHAVLMGRVPNGSQSEASQQPPSENNQQNQAVAFGDKEPYNYQQHPKVFRKGHVAYEAKTKASFEFVKNDLELKNTCSSAAAEYYDPNVSFEFVNNPLESF